MNRTTWVAGLWLAQSILLGIGTHAFALNASLDISQYAHASWKISEGFTEGTIYSIAQTVDGYLWLGTEFGLVRFDGVRPVPWEPPAGQHLPSLDIRSLQGAHDGRLWIGTGSGLASWKDRKLSVYPELAGQRIEALLEDHEGAIWVAGWSLTTGRLCRIQSGRTDCYGGDGRFGSGINPLYVDRRGTLWAGAMTGLWRWQPGLPELFRMPDPTQRIYALLESDDGGLLIVQHTGITKLRNGETEAYPLPEGFQPHRLLRDRDGGVWIGALVDQGLLHVRHGRSDRFNQAGGLSGRSVNALFEDTEGNIWVATGEGLDRFRDYAIPTFTDAQGLSSPSGFTVLSTRDGTLWFGATDGLNRWHNGAVTVYLNRGVKKNAANAIADSGLPDKAESLFEDRRGRLFVGTRNGVVVLQSGRFVPVASIPYGIVFSYTDDRAGNVWVSHQEGLFRLVGSQVVERIPWASLGSTRPASAILHDEAQQGLWLGFHDGGVAYFKGGRILRTYGAADGLGQGHVAGFSVEGNRALWAFTEGGLSRITGTRIVTLTTHNGLPCSTVHWMMEDGGDSVWLYLACGLARVKRSELDAWASNPERAIHATTFDSGDGVSSQRAVNGYHSAVTKAADGKLWFVRRGGVSIIDPAHLAFNAVPPPVHVEQIVADDKIYNPNDGLRLPPRVRNLAIKYAGLSFVAPEKVRFRYKLEGQNQGWHEVVNAREVQYTNLAPGPYRFRVMASNNSGVWNESGATLDFSIAPAYYQTRWFAALLVVATATLLWAAYRLRVAQLARQFNRTLEARVSERTRIARDLHDTMLQSFQGALLRFQSVANVIKTRPDEAAERLDRALDQAQAAITEGRDAVKGLRASATTVNDLANGIAAIGLGLPADRPADAPLVRVEVDGPSRDLNPVVRDEAYRIAGEALRNAVRHAQARHVIVTLHYERRQFRLTIRDDGTGIDGEALARQESERHFGLRGMRERAAVVNGQLDVRSVPGAGTEIELRIPWRTAYLAPGASSSV